MTTKTLDFGRSTRVWAAVAAMFLIVGAMFLGATSASAGQNGGDHGSGPGSGQHGGGGGAGNGGQGHGGSGGGHTGNGCSSYTPTALSISNPQLAPGESATVTGKGVPGTTVVVRLGSTQLGSAVVDAAGNFTVKVTIPATLTPGTYNLTVDTPSCPSPGCITIVVKPKQECDCKANPRMVQRGETVTWTLFSSLDHSAPTTVVLVPVGTGTSYTVYSGPYPASGRISITIPGNVPDGQYLVVETGLKHGKPWSMSTPT